MKTDLKDKVQLALSLLAMTSNLYPVLWLSSSNNAWAIPVFSALLAVETEITIRTYYRIKIKQLDVAQEN